MKIFHPTITGSLDISGSINVTGGQLNGTSSYAITASYAMNGGGGNSFPFSGSAVITGSLLISGSGLRIVGDQVVTGSIILHSNNVNPPTNLVVNAVYNSGGDYYANAYTHAYEIYAYVIDVNGIITYSNIYGYTSFNDNESGDQYYIDVTWDPSTTPGVTGYRILKYDTYVGSNFNVGVDTTSNTLRDDNLSYIFSSGQSSIRNTSGKLFGTASVAENIDPAIINNGVNYVLTSNGDGTITGESNLYFDGYNLGVGNLSPSAPLHVGTDTSFLKVTPNWFAAGGGTGTWLDLSLDGPSGIGSGGPGANTFFAYAAGAGNWFTDALAGDVAYRNGSGRLLFGNFTGAGNASVVLSGDNLGIGKGNPNTKLDVLGDVNITGSLNVTGVINGSVTTASTSSYSTNFKVTQTLIIDETLTDFSKYASTIVGSNNMFQQATGSYRSAHCKYNLYKTTNARAGEFVVVWNGTSVTYYDNATTDIGLTSDVIFSSEIITSQLQINAVTLSSGWTVKMLVTYI
jgi:hypothetical protein